jgi:hypothetical protein
MSLTVRYPNGQAITYNRANYLTYHEDRWNLHYRDAQGTTHWIASVQASAGAIVEAEPACEVANPLLGLTPQAAVTYLLTHLAAVHPDDLGDLKRALSHFDARRGVWTNQRALGA